MALVEGDCVSKSDLGTLKDTCNCGEDGSWVLATWQVCQARPRTTSGQGEGRHWPLGRALGGRTGWSMMLSEAGETRTREEQGDTGKSNGQRGIIGKLR
ncbi:hypothetical protein GUJ93_ZPchr0010g8168 [Zizania palustris]|uniref:Uncharacterized protein n=1 Tax=Zizania palustris TaxID=103762 RepID=A0A8J6BGT7_ZIZPA|nr:hypothetical protein GUJ93_ZPchr0010g8168 [Zizania palustris]